MYVKISRFRNQKNKIVMFIFWPLFCKTVCIKLNKINKSNLNMNPVALLYIPLYTPPHQDNHYSVFQKSHATTKIIH